MHISRHAFAHIAQEAGAESSAIKNILGHSNLATTERYMGSSDTQAVIDAIGKDRLSVRKAKERWQKATGKEACKSTFRSFL